MPGIKQHPLRHRDLPDVEVPVGKRNQHAHPAIIAAPATGGTVNDASDLERSRRLADATERSFRRGTEGHTTNRDRRHIGREVIGAQHVGPPRPSVTTSREVVGSD